MSYLLNNQELNKYDTKQLINIYVLKIKKLLK